VSQHRPKVSIGMPVYNGERFICEAIDSLLAQTFTDFELVISDNASTDSTASICQRYSKQDPRIHYIRQQDNIGVLRNFQFVLNHASGEYFMWAACDDKWDGNWIKMLHMRLKGIKNHAAFGKLIQIDECSRPLAHPANKNSFEFMGSYLKRRTSFFLEFEGKGKANLFYSLFRREALADVVLTSYDFDCLVLFDLLKKIEFISVSDVLLYKRIHSSGIGNVEPKSFGRMLLSVIVLQVLWHNFHVSEKYLSHSRGSEKFILSLLVPVRIFYSYLFYACRVFNTLFRNSLNL
jgi:glycosyltransferase involved in cell wall biosynthesis